MDLILLRHGKAEDHHPEGDFARRLVDKGREQAIRAARLLKKSRFLPAIVLTSPYLRARETATVFCEAAGMPGPVSQGWLGCGMSPETAWAELAGFTEFDRILIVGHEPDFSMLAEWLLGASGGTVEVKKGALVGIRITPPSKRGSLSFLIPPRFSENV